MDAQLTFKSIGDEFHREHNGSATGNRLGIHTDLGVRVGRKKGEGETGVEERGKIKVI